MWLNTLLYNVKYSRWYFGHYHCERVATDRCECLYDKIILWAGGGAMVPITSFGHLLIHGAMASASEYGFMGLLMGMFDLTASGIASAIIFSFFLSFIFKPQD